MKHKEIPVRSLCITLTLFLSALIAHVIGCGTFVSLPRFLLESIFLFALIGIFSRYRLEGPRLALLVLISQASVHIVLGGMMMNTSLMLKSHLALGLISYLLISHFERFWNQAKLFVYQLLNTPSLSPQISTTVLSNPCIEYFAVEHSWSERRAHALRAPPVASYTL